MNASPWGRRIPMQMMIEARADDLPTARQEVEKL